MVEPITKRLIISGLTPQITADDISRRLATFGTVKATEGFGLPDGLGEPRKFGYVTLETTSSKLAKCMNLLSGSTWKGAKLRFGEAKPDFRERMALENDQAAEEPPKKKRKRFGAVEAEDMTLVTPENAAERPGWKVSTLGRITRPVKIRPARPLTDIPEDKPKPKMSAVKFTDVGKPPDASEQKKKKKRAKVPDNRARRRTIDMTKFGSTHLKGVFLDLEVPISGVVKKDVSYDKELLAEESSDDDSADGIVSPALDATAALEPNAVEKERSVDAVAGPSKSRLPSPSAPVPVPATPTNAKALKSIPNPPPPSSLPLDIKSTMPEPNTDIQQEKAQTLNLLASLFGAADNDDDWVGRESVGSDIDIDELVKGDRMLVDEDNADFEVVPLGAPVKMAPSIPQGDDDESENNDDDEATEPQQQIEPQGRELKPKTLKDLFASQEDEVGFSLLGHLDLDIEFDDELPYTVDQVAEQSNASEEPTGPLPAPMPTPITLQASASQAPLVLDPRQALFFPLPREGISNRARQRDVYDLAKDNGWNWRDPAVGFFRTGTDEDIKKRWEESKGDLTRDWKRRCREAGKVNRRKRGGVAGENE